MNPGWCRSRWISWRTAVYKVRLLDSDWRLYFPPYCGVLNTVLTVVHSLTPFLPACLGSSKYSTRKGYPQIAAHWQVLVHDASCPTPPASGKSTLVITPSSRLCSPICNSGHYSNECQSHFKSFQPSQSGCGGSFGCEVSRHSIRKAPDPGMPAGNLRPARTATMYSSRTLPPSPVHLV